VNKIPLVFLHGWAKNKGDYAPLLRSLSPNVKVFPLDLPGFGTEPILKAMDLDDYAQFVTRFIKKNNLGSVIVGGHSFGGRVAIKLTLNYPELVKKLILVDSAGIERKSLKTKILQIFAAITPTRIKELARPLVGSKDYLASVGLVRETMKNIVAENLEPDLSKIAVPTLIVWGDRDHTTPLWQGNLMHKLINRSQMVIIPGGDHGVPYRRGQEAATAINKFL